MVRLDLLGSAGGSEEKVTGRNVRGRYLVGLTFAAARCA